jgi:CRP-like cAMP-binding protein
MDDQARAALERCMMTEHHPKDALIIRSGEITRTLMLVQSGTVALSTAEMPGTGLRLASIGQGVNFGEMAFLNGSARTAYAHAGEDGALICSIEWTQFKAWGKEYPVAAFGFMEELARAGTRRLGETSQALRAALE